MGLDRRGQRDVRQRTDVPGIEGGEGRRPDEVARLGAAGTLEEEKGRVLGVAPTTSWRFTDPAPRTGIPQGRHAHVLQPGGLLSAEDLLEHVWDAQADPFTSSVRVILSRLRRKLGAPDAITTVPSAGYRLEARP